MTLQSTAIEATEPEASLDALLAMRPIYAKNLEVVAFDPVIQSFEGSELTGEGNYRALSLIIAESYSSVPSKQGQRAVPSFLRVCAGALTSLELPDFPADRFIFEVCPSDVDCPDAAARYRALAGEGYRIALAIDDADFDVDQDYLKFVHILRIDVGTVGMEKLPALVKRAMPHGLDLAADNLATRQDFVSCVDLGFRYFSGDVLGKPKPSENKKLGHNSVVLFQLLSELQNPNASTAVIEEIVLRDPSLTFKILKIVNSAAVGLSREIQSVSHAINILGMTQVRRWVSVFLLEDGGDKPMELMRSALVRARMCELMAEVSEKEMPMSYFMTGLLSNLDTIAEIPMSEIVDQVPLSQSIKDALVDRAGDMGSYLREVEYYEKGRFDALQGIMDKAFYEPCYRHCISWANQVQGAMVS
ncbi:HDOD domain-containing protein [Mangrovimicrobium sediminis]|uniref:HDOD domain-containing protein n=1 Tax=Mangrovimicrobium sediminis TaxID=2562682 RepID=A0A4Z0M0S9_9GAMM|nr:HDOD domain-containing protein [Haliea sp. SAOS-164]TGD73129.1 HDOD domain-containing protein [Haliea sp. SAOS-164]